MTRLTRTQQAHNRRIDRVVAAQVSRIHAQAHAEGSALAACGHPFNAHSDELSGRYCAGCEAYCGDACLAGDPVFGS